MRKLSNTDLNRLTISQYQNKEKNKVTVVLDNVRSLNNIGSIFRTCDAFAVEKIILCGISGTPPHKDIRKTAIGAEKSVNWLYEENSVTAVKKLKSKGYFIVGVEQTSESKELQKDLFTTEPIALVFGNEINGVDQDILDLCDICTEIPQFGTKHSFNVSVSVALVLWELLRKD
jgi:tRNA G18 (ribose-2'-O)-methylase SpoU